MRFAVAAVRALSTGLAVLAGFATFVIMVIIAADVTLRFLGSGVPGTLEIVTYYLMVIVAFLALGNLERKDGMISVDVVFNVLGVGGRRWMMVFAGVVSTLVMAGIAYGSLLEAMSQYRSGSYVVTLRYVLPIWPTYFIVPVAFAVAAFVSALRTFIAAMGPRVDADLRSEMGLDEIFGRPASPATSSSGDRT